MGHTATLSLSIFENKNLTKPLNFHKYHHITPYVTSIRSDFEFLLYFSMKILLAKRIAPDETPHYAHNMELYCLPTRHRMSGLFEFMSTLKLKAFSFMTKLLRNAIVRLFMKSQFIGVNRVGRLNKAIITL